jgi:chromosome segregation ATPase
MGISTNPRQSDSLRQLGLLRDVLTDPEKYRTIVDEATQAADRLEAAVSAHTTVKKANEYYQQARVVEAAAVAAAEESEKVQESQRSAMATALAAHRDKLAAEAQASRDAIDKINADRRTLDAEIEAVAKDRQRLTSWSEQLQKQEQFLKISERSLAEKINKIGQVMSGGL